VHLGEVSIHAHMDDDDSGGRSLTKDDASTSECTHTHTHTIENQLVRRRGAGRRPMLLDVHQCDAPRLAASIGG
jgi:hypothetical protein